MTTLCWGTVASASTLEELTDAALAGGFDAISVTPAMGAVFAGHRPRLPVASVDALLGVLPGSPPIGSIAPEMRHFFEPGVDGCLAALERTGARVLNVAHFLGGPAPLAEMVDAFGSLCERFASEGVRLTLEFIPGSGVPDLATALAIVSGAGNADAGVLLDTWHLARSGGTVDDVVDATPGAVRAVQLSDRHAEPDGAAYVPMSDRLLPGDGDLPLADIVRAARANCADVDVAVEVFSSVLARLSPTEAGARAAPRSAISASADRSGGPHPVTCRAWGSSCSSSCAARAAPRRMSSRRTGATCTPASWPTTRTWPDT